MFFKKVLLLIGEDAGGSKSGNIETDLEAPCPDKNDEGLDKGSSGGSRDLLDVKYILKTEPNGLTDSLDVGR